jgi:hypothetical protein
MTAYKLATYESENGPRAGIIVGDAVFDAAELSGQATYTSVLRILEDWARAKDILAGARAKNGRRLEASQKPICARRSFGRPPSIAPGANLPRPRRRNGAEASIVPLDPIRN